MPDEGREAPPAAPASAVPGGGREERPLVPRSPRETVPAGLPAAPTRTPGWREVLLVAGLVLAAVFTVELASATVPPLGDVFRRFPTTIVILVVGTVGLMILLAARRHP